MKNLRITLGVAAIAIGSFAAFSFAPAKVDSKVALQDFYMNPDGTRGAQVTGSTDCLDESSVICSQQWDTSTNKPTGRNIHYYPRP
ncbi:hypothetical protein [Chryseobacterium camelliae]|uniref:hypothetical protein n=1 Tax=Chryseobacterium camelliae TaxID=1265445 RepID=UPI00285A7005|nr:hypothetical protein [Chryseobacterium camelliae]MDR6513681.1 hypothetical protein [Chryseobacterium camelliae]